MTQPMLNSLRLHQGDPEIPICLITRSQRKMAIHRSSTSTLSCKDDISCLAYLGQHLHVDHGQEFIYFPLHQKTIEVYRTVSHLTARCELHAATCGATSRSERKTCVSLHKRSRFHTAKNHADTGSSERRWLLDRAQSSDATRCKHRKSPKRCVVL